jgi:glycosyltransferase involved in cell wall biosynthesis
MKFTIVNNIFYDYQGINLNLGGVETYLQELSLLLEDLGHQVKIIQMSEIDFVKQFNQTVTVYGFSNCNIRLPTNKKFLALVKHKVKDSIVIWGSDQLSMRLPNNESITIQHGIGFDCEAFDSGFRKLFPLLGLKKFYKFLQRYRALKLFENSKNAICVDYNFLCWYRTMRPYSTGFNHQVIPNFARLPSENIKKIESDDVKVVFARRFVSRRGIDIFLPAISRLMNERPNVNVTFAGGGGRLNDIEKFCAEYSRANIAFYSYPDSLEFHSKFDIAVVPSIGSEGTSLSLLEAMSAGCAVIATNVGGLTNIVIDNHNGLMVNPEITQLYKAMLRLVDEKELRLRLSSNAKVIVKNSFSINIWRNRWTSYINALSDNNRFKKG